MFIVVYDPPAADDLVRLLRRHGYRAWKRTAFVVQLDGRPDEAEVEHLLAQWLEARPYVRAELVTPSRVRAPARV